MAHYAFIDDDGLVVEVITGVDENETVNGITGTEGWEAFYATQRPGLQCRRTSYHGNIRGRYAGIGYRYDEDLDMFVAPQPYPSWTLDDSGDWQPPVPMPEGMWMWNETEQQWEPIDV